MPGGLKIAYAGTPELAAYILKQIIDDNRHTISLVLSQPDRPAGRGKKPQQSPVTQISKLKKLTLYQPASRADLETYIEKFDDLDLMIVAAYGIILSEKVLHKPRLGCINIHTSLLPRWRGAAPVQQAILAGDKDTGITIMQMDEGLDTGDILFQESCPIQETDTSGILYERLAKIGAQCILTTLDLLMKDNITPQQQDDTQATYAEKIYKTDARIDWSRPAIQIDRLIRAMNPAPIAYTELNEVIVRIWESQILDLDTSKIPAGKILNYSGSGLDISTMDKAIRILKLQLPGKKILGCREFYNGHPGIWTSYPSFDPS